MRRSVSVSAKQAVTYPPLLWYGKASELCTNKLFTYGHTKGAHLLHFVPCSGRGGNAELQKFAAISERVYLSV